MATVTLLASGTQTTSGVGSDVSAASTNLVGMFVSVSAVSGVLPTLVVQLQHSPNGTEWYNVTDVVNSSNIVSISLNGLLPSNTRVIADDVRAVWTIGGVNPSFTFKVELVTT